MGQWCWSLPRGCWAPSQSPWPCLAWQEHPPPHPSLGSRELPLPGVIVTTLQSGCPHGPAMAVAPPALSVGRGQEGPILLPPRLQCSPPELPAGTRGSIPPEKPQESHVGKSPGCQGCSPRAVPEAFVLPLQPRGRNRVIPSPEGMGSPSLRPARARGTTGLSL